MKKLFILIIICLMLCSCGTKNTTSKFLNNDDLQTIISENNYIIVDVRTKEEYEELHIVNSINIPYNEITEETELDKTKKILVYCRSGNRSTTAYNTLKSLGYDVYNLGGINDIELEKE